jgi:transmembrane sensor
VGPRELLDAAQRAKLAGQPRAAGAAFDALRRRFRSDPRAALAAFELGRLRLENLGDAPGAVEAFDDAIALAPGGPLREDAEARRVEALAVERSPRCAAARDSFLSRFPGSAHAAVVAGRCARD